MNSDSWQTTRRFGAMLSCRPHLFTQSEWLVSQLSYNERTRKFFLDKRGGFSPLSRRKRTSTFPPGLELAFVFFAKPHRARLLVFPVLLARDGPGRDHPIAPGLPLGIAIG